MRQRSACVVHFNYVNCIICLYLRIKLLIICMKYSLILLIFLSALNSHSQTYNSLSVDANIGLNSALGPFAEGYQSNFLGVYHADANVRYMLTNKFGIMWGLGFDRIKWDEFGGYQADNKYFKVHYIRTSFQAVFNVGRIADFQEIHDRFGLLLHAGFGFSSLKDAHNSVWFENWKTQGTDEMMHLLIGFTPQLRLTDYLAIHADFTYVGNIWQTKTFDFTTPNEFRKGVDGRIATFSAGLSYYFGRDGKGKKHLDWVSDDSGINKNSDLQPGDTIITKETIRTIETIRIIEGDTTTNPQIEKPGGDGYGANEDFDGDGVPNSEDACPTTAGTDPNGCPSADRDGDGIANTIDDCPDVKGVAENGGCPEIDKDARDILDEGSREVRFEEGSDVIQIESRGHLDKIVKVLIDHPEYKLGVDVHVAEGAESGPNLSLSRSRAKRVSDYFVSKGIKVDRIKAEGYGSTIPVEGNETRIEFSVKYK